jgi:acyl carrier protein
MNEPSRWIFTAIRQLPEQGDNGREAPVFSCEKNPKIESDISAWLTEHVANYCEKKTSEIDPAVSLADYGMDSYYAVTLTSDIECKYGLAMDPTVIWENSTVAALAAAVVRLMPTETR